MNKSNEIINTMYCIGGYVAGLLGFIAVFGPFYLAYLLFQNGFDANILFFLVIFTFFCWSFAIYIFLSNKIIEEYMNK